MGIFKDIATSPLGDVTLGAFEALDNIAVRDARNNATIANDSLNKENEAFKKTELAFKNKGQIVNILKQNPEAFGISAGDLTTDQIAERLAGFMFNNERTIFENNDFNKVKLGVANFLARNPGEGFELADPYVASADMFNKEKQLHAAKLSEISKMPKADKLLFNIEEAQAEVPDPEIITDKLTKVAALSAKGYGILRSFPTSAEGVTNLKFMQTNIIVANARALFPNDNAKRMDFINKKLYDNNIDPLEAIRFQSPVTFKSMVTILDAQARGAASQITELNNAFAQAETDEQRKQITQQLDNLILGQYRTINEFSAEAGKITAGKDRNLVYREGEVSTAIQIPEAAEGYVPSVDNKGQVIVERADGINQKLDLELLINEPDNLKVLPQITQDYVNQIKDNLFKDGNMIKPTREMFESGPEGDKAFKDFLRLYNVLGQEEIDLAEIGGIGEIKSPPKLNLKDADISKFKVPDPNKVTDSNKIEVEELPSDNQENKQDTDQEPDVFEESGVKPEFQSASLKDKFGTGAISFKKLTKNKNMEFAYNYLNKTLSPEASAALLGNIYGENSNFVFDLEEQGVTRKNKGYGLFQFTDNKKGEGHRKEYFKYLNDTNKDDSIESQIDYVMDNINKGIGYDIGAGNREKLKEIFKTGTVEEITKAFHNIFERPKSPESLDKRINFAKEAFNFYRGI